MTKSHLWNKFPKPDPAKVVHDINMRFGDTGPIIRPADKAWDASDLRRPCGIPSLDLASGGGLVAGKAHQVDGPESCLAGDTFLPYTVYSINGKLVNSKGGSICHLYERFHERIVEGEPNQGRHLERHDVIFYVKSMDDSGRIIRNRVLDVVSTGKKQCYRVETDLRQSLVSTLDHKYLTPTGYKALSDLRVGDTILVHNNTRVRGRKQSINRPRNLSFIASTAILTKIDKDQIRDTYDLKCAYPNNNYVAAKFIVHNCGKNYLLYRYFAEAQRNYSDKAVLAMCCFESMIDKQFAQMCGCKIAMSKYDLEVSNVARAARGEPPLTKAEEKAALRCSGIGAFHIFEGPSEKVLDGTVEAVKSNIYQIIGIDSWDSMMTAPEEKAELGVTPQLASPATLQTRWAKKILDAFNAIYRCDKCGYSPLEKKVTNYQLQNYKYVCPDCGWKGDEPFTEVNETTLYCIRQVRAKISMGGKQYGRPYKSGGTYALQHLNHIRISLHPGQSLRDNSKKMMGKEVNWEITKAKAGAKEGRTGSFTLVFEPIEVDVASDMLAQCLIHKVIVAEGGGYYSVPDIEMDRVHGKDSMLEMIEREHELRELLRELLYIKADLAHVRFT